MGGALGEDSWTAIAVIAGLYAPLAYAGLFCIVDPTKIAGLLNRIVSELQEIEDSAPAADAAGSRGLRSGIRLAGAALVIFCLARSFELLAAASL